MLQKYGISSRIYHVSWRYARWGLKSCFNLFSICLLTKLSESGVGCYMGDNFLGALGYADDIVLIALSPSAMRSL